jgi:hypothetical protein
LLIGYAALTSSKWALAKSGTNGDVLLKKLILFVTGLSKRVSTIFKILSTGPWTVYTMLDITLIIVGLLVVMPLPLILAISSLVIGVTLAIDSYLVYSTSLSTSLK